MQRPDRGTPPAPPEVLGRSVAAAAGWAEHIGGAPAHVFATGRANLVVAAAPLPAPPMTATEEARLRVWFPKLPKRIVELNGHQLGHLYADRLARVEGEVAFALDLDSDGNMPAAGPYGPPPSPKVDVLLFGTARAARAAADFLFDADVWIPGGGFFGGRPAAVAHAADGAAAHRRFVYSTALARYRALIGAGGATPPWIGVGLAHTLEARVAGGDLGDAAAGTTPPDVLAERRAAEASDRDDYLRLLVDAGHAGQWNALCLSEEDALSARSRLQAGGFVRFLLGADRARFALLVRTLASAGAGEARDRAFDAAARAVFGRPAATLDEAWRLWTQRAGTSAR